MDSQNVTQDACNLQAINLPEKQGEEVRRRAGVEIVRSADLSSRYFHAPKRVRCYRRLHQEPEIVSSKRGLLDE